VCEPVSIGVGTALLVGGGTAGFTSATAGTAIAIGLTAGSGALAAASQIEAANAAEDVARYNASIRSIQARDAVERGELEEREFRRRASRVLGAQRAAFGASGVQLDSGSPLDVLEDTAATAELDALTIRSNAQREAFAFEAGATAFRNEADNVRRLGQLQATGTILGSVGALTRTGIQSGISFGRSRGRIDPFRGRPFGIRG
jgi:hypothetical protein